MHPDLKLKIFRASAAAKGIQHYELAKMCGLSRPAFSLMINGHRDMPADIENKLIGALSLERTFKALSEWKEEAIV